MSLGQCQEAFKSNGTLSCDSEPHRPPLVLSSTVGSVRRNKLVTHSPQQVPFIINKSGGFLVSVSSVNMGDGPS